MGYLPRKKDILPLKAFKESSSIEQIKEKMIKDLEEKVEDLGVARQVASVLTFVRSDINI